MLLRGYLHHGDEIIVSFKGVLSGETFDEVTVRVFLFLLIQVGWEREI